MFKAEPGMQLSGMGEGQAEELVVDGNIWLWKAWCGVCAMEETR